MDTTTTTLGVLAIGIVVVVGGVLLFRLHAFLALVLGACAVGALTPASSVRSYSLRRDGFPIVSPDGFSSLDMVEDDETKTVTVGANEVLLKLRNQRDIDRGEACRVFRTDGSTPELDDRFQLRITSIVKGKLPTDRVETLALAEVISANTKDKPEPGGLAVTLPAVRAAESLSGQTFAARVTTAFGSTCGKIGILIALASIVGMCLLESGAADRVVRSTLKLFGERGAPASFLTSGFLLGIPVFFDTVFYLMIPLGKAMRLRTGRNYLLYVLTIVAGATMAHSLVPPTPGPLFVAEQLGVDIGMMILAGCIVGFFTAGFGYLYASFAARIWDLPLRESADISTEDLEQITQRDESELPPFWLSLAPILLPVILIGGNTILKGLSGIPDGVKQIGAILGDKNVALGLSAAIAMATLIWQKKSNLKEMAGSVQSSLASGGVIILITAAGGAFGAVLQQTGVSGLIRDLPAASPLAIIGLAFLITAAIRTAQGSATVAMITAVGILSGIASSGTLGFHPVYLALAIGCGSKPIAWMNDSGFWVITRMSGMTEAEGLKYVTPMTTAMGLVGLIVTMIGVMLFPLA